MKRHTEIKLPEAVPVETKSVAEKQRACQQYTLCPREQVSLSVMIGIQTHSTPQHGRAILVKLWIAALRRANASGTERVSRSVRTRSVKGRACTRNESTAPIRAARLHGICPLKICTPDLGPRLHVRRQRWPRKSIHGRVGSPRSAEEEPTQQK